MDNSNDQSISKKLMVFDGFVVALIFVMIFVIKYKNNEIKKTEQTAAAIQTEIENTAFKDVKLLAKSAFVYDVANDRVLFELNADKQLPLASLTKIMMALTAAESLPSDSKITIKKEFLQEEGDSGLLSNESWKLKDLLDFSLVVSSNDGARSIASVIGALNLKNNDYELGRKEFISMMNKKSQEIGLKNTYFINESGLDIDSFSGGYGSAHDIAKLLEYTIAHKPDLLDATKYETLSISSTSKIHKANNTNTEISQIPNLIASKTGYTSQAGGNLAIAFDASMQRPIIIVVLGSTQEGRFSDIDTLVKASIKYVAK